MKNGDITNQRDVCSWLVGLALRALEQGFEVVGIRRLPHQGSAMLTAGYAGDEQPIVALPIDEKRLADGDPGRTRAYFAERWRLIGAAKTPATSPSALSWTKGDPIELLACEYLRLHQLTERAKDVREQLVEEMTARGRTAIDVQGVGAVTLQPASTRQSLDAAGVRAMVASLAARLRERGVEVVDALPMKSTKVGASLRVTLAG